MDHVGIAGIYHLLVSSFAPDLVLAPQSAWLADAVLTICCNILMYAVAQSEFLIGIVPLARIRVPVGFSIGLVQ